MSENFLFSISEATTLVKGFLQCTLPKEQWTHEAHLITGLYLVAHDEEGALDKMRTGLREYNASVGGVNDDHNGYHETMTVFWLWAIRYYCGDESGKVTWDQDSIDDLLFEEDLAERNLWKQFYSEPVMKSVEARRHYIEPDIKPMPAVVKG